MKQKLLHTCIGYLFLAILYFNSGGQFISSFGFFTGMEQVILNTEAETNTKDKDHSKDISLNEYFVNLSKLSVYNFVAGIHVKLLRDIDHLLAQSFFPVIPTPPPNC